LGRHHLTFETPQNILRQIIHLAAQLSFSNELTISHHVVLMSPNMPVNNVKGKVLRVLGTLETLAPHPNSIPVIPLVEHIPYCCWDQLRNQGLRHQNESIPVRCTWSYATGSTHLLKRHFFCSQSPLSTIF